MTRKLSWNLLFFILAVGTGIAFSLKPWQVFREQQLKADEARQEMRQAEAKMEELSRQKAKYESPLGREELAREKNFVKPGEQLIDLN